MYIEIITVNVKLYTILFEQVVMLGDDEINIFNKFLVISNYSKYINLLQKEV